MKTFCLHFCRFRTAVLHSPAGDEERFQSTFSSAIKLKFFNDLIPRTCYPTMNVINRLANQSKPTIHISKRYARKRNFKSWKNDWLPFNWVRPEAEQGYFSTGDRIEKIELFDKSAMPKAHQDAIKEVGDVPKEIQNLLTYEFYRRRENAKEFREEQVKNRSSNAIGVEWYKGRVIDYTYKIRKGRQMLRDCPNDVYTKTKVSHWNNQRFSMLIELYKYDKEDYYRLLKELEVDEPKMVMGDILTTRIERKKELKRLTKEYCDKLVQDKLKAYHDKLKERQRVFENELAEFEGWSTKMMKELKIDESEVNVD